MRSVVVAFPNPVMASLVSSVLVKGGYVVEDTCKTAAELIRVSNFCNSPVAVCSASFQDMSTLALSEAVGGRMALVAVALSHQCQFVGSDRIPFVRYPFSAKELVDLVAKTEMNAACRAVFAGEGPLFDPHRRERSAEEKLCILKAKELLMAQSGMTEAQAHRFLQKTSMDRKMKLIDFAREVLSGTAGIGVPGEDRIMAG